jgi:hypothetical protein
MNVRGELSRWGVENRKTGKDTKGEEEWQCNGGGELFTVHHTHVWDYHNETPIITAC